MRRSALLAIVLAGSAFATSVQAWGSTGHRITGAIAERHLTDRARVGVQSILGSETLAEASTWPDFMRQSPDPFWRTAGAFHSVEVPEGQAYSGQTAPPQGDAVEALTNFAAIVRDETAPLAQRQLALRFIVHIVGDLHAPLHACSGLDHCGGDVAVQFFGRSTNLHMLWDEDMIDHERLSYSEWADWLNTPLTEADVRRLWQADPAVWIAESVGVRPSVYPGEVFDSKIYRFQHRPLLERRLSEAGVRIAAYLDALFGASM